VKKNFEPILTDPMWERLKIAFGQLGIYITKNTRKNIEGILHRMKIGCPWRYIPSDVCDWSTAFACFNNWSYRCLWQEMFYCLRGELDPEWNFIDGSHIKVHQDGCGSRKGERRDIGVSRGGKNTKIHMSADANGNPVDFILTGGEVHDNKVATEVIDLFDADEVIADKAYDSENTREHAREKGSVPNIPRKSNSTKSNPEFDKEIYKLRHLVENLFAKIKRNRAISTRYDKLSRNFKSLVYIACFMIWIKL
jgi:transposase